jgi:non-canonical (house-cleaning) NTP pyrophosphatase
LNAQSNAAKEAFEAVFPAPAYRIEISCVDVDSNVSPQPSSDIETQTGALNRARAAQKERPGCDFYVGLEGGFCPMPNLTAEPEPFMKMELHNFAWAIVLQNGNQKVGAVRSASFQLPECLTEKLNTVLRWLSMSAACC